MTSTQLRPTRRTLVRGAAWTVPVVSIAAAAPAFAASPCAASYPFRLNWGGTTYATSTSGGTKTGTATVAGPAGSSSVTVTFKSTFVGTPDKRDGTNLTDDGTTNVGGVNGERGLVLYHRNILASRDSRQLVTISFSRPVTGLKFLITDIDSNTGGFRDQVELSGTRTGTAVSRGGGNFYVEGAGTELSPWQMYNDNTAVPDSGGNRGNIAVEYPGEVSSFDLVYWNAAGNGQQAIFLGDFTFTAKAC